MPYRMVNAAGPWTAGQVVDDKEFEAHTFAEKFINVGAAVKVGKDEKERPSQVQAEINALERQIGELNAKRDALINPAAEGAVTFDLPATGEQPNPEQDAVRAAGDEVVQPTSANPNAGEVVPEDKAKKK